MKAIGRTKAEQVVAHSKRKRGRNPSMTFAGISNPRIALELAKLAERDERGEISLIILELIPSNHHGERVPGQLWGCTQIDRTGYLTSTADFLLAVGDMIRRKTYFPEEYGALPEAIESLIRDKFPITGSDHTPKQKSRVEKSYRLWDDCYDAGDYHRALGKYCYHLREQLGFEFVVYEGPDFGMHTGNVSTDKVRRITTADVMGCMNHARVLYQMGCRATQEGDAIRVVTPNGKATEFNRAANDVKEKLLDFGISVQNRYHVLPDLVHITEEAA